MTRISFVVIGKNEGKMLGKCLESLKAADYPRHLAEVTEVIYVDSRSTDRSVEIAREHGATVHLLSAGRTSSARARNAGLQLCQGDLVQFLDADMVLAKDWLQRAVPILLEEGVIGVAGRIDDYQRKPSWYDRVHTAQQMFHRPEIGGMGSGGGLFRAEEFRKLGGYNDKMPFGEEAELGEYLRSSGRGILRIVDLMAYHDYGFDTFRAYCRRLVRDGMVQALAWRRGAQGRWRTLLRSVITPLFWLLAPLASLLLRNPLPVVLALCWAAYVFFRTATHIFLRERTLKLALTCGAHICFAKFPHLWGWCRVMLMREFSGQRPARSSPRAPRIGFFMKEFPALSETLVYREILELRRLGMDLRALAVRRPPPRAVLSQESLILIDETLYLTPLPWGRIILAGLRHLFCRPRVVLRFFARYQIRRLGLRDRLKACFHFLQGLRLAAFIHEENIDHIHCHFATTALAAQVGCALSGIRYSFTAHHHDIDESSSTADILLTAEKVKGARFIVAISEYMKRLILDRAPGTDPDRIKVLHMGVDVERFQPSDKARENEVPHFLSVGRLVEDKDYPTLIEACRILKQRGESFSWSVVGEGADREKLEALCKEKGVDTFLHFLGALPQERLADYYERTNIFVLSSLAEGVPGVLMEAMAKGIPLVATSVGGVPELVIHNQNGLLVPPADPAALADAIMRLMHDVSLSQRIGREARNRVMEDFNLHKNADRLKHLFTAMLLPAAQEEKTETEGSTQIVLSEADR